MMNTAAFIRQIPTLAWVIMLTVLCGGLFSNLIGNLTPELSASLNLTPKHIGWLVFIGSTGSAVGAFLGGDIVARVRAQRLIRGYLLGIMGAVLGLVLSTHFVGLSIAFFVYEVMLTALLTLAHTLIGQMDLISTVRARVLALLDVGWSVGASIAPIWVMILLLVFNSWRVPYIAFILLIVLLFVVYQRSSIQAAILAIGLAVAARSADRSSGGMTSHSDGVEHARRDTYLDLMRAPEMIWAWVAAILIGYVEWGHTYWFVHYAHTGRTIDLNTARWALLAFTVGMVVVRTWQSFIHSALSFEQRLLRLGWLGFGMFAFIALTPDSASATYLVVINFFAGVGIGVVFPILLNHLIDLSPHNTAKLSALLMFAVIIGAQLAGLVVGYTAQWLDIRWAYASIALAMLGFSLSLLRLFAAHRVHAAF